MSSLKKAVVVLALVVSLGGFASASEDAGELIREGISLYDSGKLEDAAQRFKAALKMDGTNDEALYRLACAYADMGECDLCVSTAKEGIELEGEHAGPLYAVLGSCYQADGKAGSALRIYRRGLKRHPNDASLNYNLASTLVTNGKSEEAIEHLQTVIREQPTHASAYYLMGSLFATDKQHLSAMCSYMRFFSLEPNGQRASRASREVFRLLELGGGTQAGGAEALVSFMQARAQPSDQETEQTFSGEHLASLSLAMQQDEVLEPFAYALAARAGIDGAVEWLEENPAKFRQLNRFLSKNGTPEG